MDKKERFGLLLYPAEKQALGRLAEADGGLSLAATLRRLIRIETQRRGLWPQEGEQNHQTQPSLEAPDA